MTEIHLSDEDRAFIEDRVQSGIYEDADAVITAGLRLLGSGEGKVLELQRLLQEGIDDIEAGRVMEFASGEALTAHILKMAEEQKNAIASPADIAKGAKRSAGYS